MRLRLKLRLRLIAAAFVASAISINIMGCSVKVEEAFSDTSSEYADSGNSIESPTETVTGSPSASPDTVTDSPTPIPTPTPNPTFTPTERPTQTPQPVDYSVIKPYEIGQVMIIMYHSIVEERGNDSYKRTIEEFKNDLQELYDRGFRLISLKDLMDNNITTEAGYTPVVITFDDGLPTSFSLIESESDNGGFKPLPDSGFDILQKFYEEHPDFGMAATFFINGNNDPFRGSGTLSDRLQYLVDNGCDIGNHTYDHSSLSNMSADEIQEELAKTDIIIREALPGYEPVGVSYPYGERPKDDELKLFVLSGKFDGHVYSYGFAIREGQSGAHSAPNNKKFDILNVPRVRGSNDDPTDLWGALTLYEKSPEYRYISDGNPQTIVIPSEYEHNLNEESLGDKMLIIYD